MIVIDYIIFPHTARVRPERSSAARLGVVLVLLRTLSCPGGSLKG